MTPDDVYLLVTTLMNRTHTYQIITIVLIAVLSAFALPASVLFIFDARDRRRQYDQNKRLLDMAEKHGLLTDDKLRGHAQAIAREVRHILEVKQQVSEAKQDIADVKEKVAGVKDVVDKTAPLIIAAMQPEETVDPDNPPKRRAEDRKS